MEKYAELKARMFDVTSLINTLTSELISLAEQSAMKDKQIAEMKEQIDNLTAPKAEDAE